MRQLDADSTALDVVSLPITGRKAYLKRDDLIHPAMSGNKWRKLKGYLPTDKHTAIITCGGQHSNHLYAFAHLASFIDNPCYAILRGEKDYGSTVLPGLIENGVHSYFLSADKYRDLRLTQSPSRYFKNFPSGIFIPEGGFGTEGLVGVIEVAEEINEQVETPTEVIAACGTGTTIAGLSLRLNHQHSLIGVKMLQDGGIEQQVKKISKEYKRIEFIYHKALGKFAERSREVEQFIVQFYEKNEILLDPIYTGKMIYIIDRLLSEGLLEIDKELLFYHSGGLHGYVAYRNRYPDAEGNFKTLVRRGIL